MKKYFYILSLGAALFLSSCDDRLDLAPFDAIQSENALLTPADFENGVRGLYVLMRPDGYYSNQMISVPDVISDNLTFNPLGRGTQESMHNFEYNANDTQFALMANAYRVVQHANFILEYTDRLPVGEFRDNIVAEAKTARALAHFDVIRFFAKIPTQSADANASPGLPYLTDSNVSQTQPRISVADFYAQLALDLNEAATGINADNGAGRLNLNSVYALLSRVELYRGNWAAAAAAADLVTTAVGDRASFTGVWNDSNDSGVIFEIKLIQQNTDATPGTVYNQTVSGQIRSEYVVSFELNNLYQSNDIRKSAYTLAGPWDGVTQNHVIKWRTSSVNAAAGRVDIKVLRAAEVQLNKAEALANLGGQDAAALTALDLVRANRYTGFVSGGETGQALKNAIQLERRLELAFEGHRFFDLKRNNLPINRQNTGHIADGSGIPSEQLLLSAGDCRFQLPIPREEINLNPNMVQNDCSFY